MIEVVGTWDDLVIREVRAYRDRVEPKERHRLYQVEGVWHMSGDDDGVAGFQYAAESRMKLDKDVADAMGEGPSYIPTVREAFDHLVAGSKKEQRRQPVRPSSQAASFADHVRATEARRHGATFGIHGAAKQHWHFERVSAPPCLRGDLYVYSVGCRLCHSVACSYASATRQTVASSYSRPVTMIACGMLSMKPLFSAIAG